MRTERKKIGKLFTSKFVGTGPSSYKKKNLPGRGLTKVEEHWYRHTVDVHFLSRCMEIRTQNKTCNENIHTCKQYVYYVKKYSFNRQVMAI